MDPMKHQKNKDKTTSRKEERGHEFPVLERSTPSNRPEAPFRHEDEAGDFRELTAASSYQIISAKKEDKFLKKRKIQEAEEAARRSGISQAKITARKEELEQQEIHVSERSTASSKRPLAPTRSDKFLKTRKIREAEEAARGSRISKEEEEDELKIGLSIKKRKKSGKALSYIQDGMWTEDQMLKRLTSFLQGDVKIFTTTCVCEELHMDMDKSDLHRQSLSIATSLKTISCCHEKSGAESCISSIIGTRNTGHYFVATNLRRLRRKLLQIQATPVLYILHHELVLHPVSPLQKEFLDSKNRMREQRRLQEEKRMLEIEMEERARAGTSSGANEQKKKKKLSKEERERLKDRPRFRRKKVAKGPNPLSCLKKKKKVPVQKQAGTSPSSEQNKKKVPVLEKPAGNDPEAPNADQKDAKLAESTTLESAKRKRKRKRVRKKKCDKDETSGQGQAQS